MIKLLAVHIIPLRELVAITRHIVSIPFYHLLLRANKNFLLNIVDWNPHFTRTRHLDFRPRQRRFSPVQARWWITQLQHAQETTLYVFLEHPDITPLEKITTAHFSNSVQNFACFGAGLNLTFCSFRSCSGLNFIHTSCSPLLWYDDIFLGWKVLSLQVLDLLVGNQLNSLIMPQIILLCCDGLPSVGGGVSGCQRSSSQ